ncbi:MAG: aldo/keto reductase [Cyanobacteria bacterium HKST-UBA02]|nr:aldo/keto reductase [Cyanobacteria bacterium HKST-UBA02]
MEKRVLGNTGMEVSILGFGGAEIGFEEARENTVDELLNEAIDAGLNVIDTAECYLGSESLIGNTVSGRRKDFFLFTKCGHGYDPTIPAWTKPEIESSIDRSLKRLKTDYVDLLQLHSCSEEILRQGDVIEALKEAKQKGKTRFIGYSGDGTDALYAIETGVFDTLQTSVNIADQECLELTIPKAVARGMGVIAKRPIANAVWRYRSTPDNSYHQPYWERLQELDYDFVNGDMTRAVGTSLRFTLSVPGVHTAIVGTKKPGRWRENARMLATGLLSEKDFDAIRIRWKEVAKADWIGQV